MYLEKNKNSLRAADSSQRDTAYAFLPDRVGFEWPCRLEFIKETENTFQFFKRSEMMSGEPVPSGAIPSFCHSRPRFHEDKLRRESGLYVRQLPSVVEFWTIEAIVLHFWIIRSSRMITTRWMRLPRRPFRTARNDQFFTKSVNLSKNLIHRIFDHDRGVPC
jgi:hypothetical protein